MFICKSQYFVMQNKHKSLCLSKAFDCGILVGECLSHNVLWCSHLGPSEQLKSAFQNISAACLNILYCVNLFMNTDVFCD